MNWIIRFGEWMEARRVLRTPDREAIAALLLQTDRRINEVNAQLEKRIEESQKDSYSKSTATELFSQIAKALAEVNIDLNNIKNNQQIPQTIAKEFALAKARIDRLELLTGLKREPEAIQVKGAPRIE